MDGYFKEYAKSFHPTTSANYHLLSYWNSDIGFFFFHDNKNKKRKPSLNIFNADHPNGTIGNYNHSVLPHARIEKLFVGIRYKKAR